MVVDDRREQRGKRSRRRQKCSAFAYLRRKLAPRQLATRYEKGLASGTSKQHFPAGAEAQDVIEIVHPIHRWSSSYPLAIPLRPCSSTLGASSPSLVSSPLNVRDCKNCTAKNYVSTASGRRARSARTCSAVLHDGHRPFLISENDS